MAKDDRSPLNPFTGKKHHDTVNDDRFLEECYQEYYKIVNSAQIIDNTAEGRMINNVATNLINAVYTYLSSIGRLDYVEDYYDWEFHLLLDNTVNAFCIPGGKIAVYSGILSVANNEEELAFILGHEMAHALLDHTRTRMSAQNTKDTLASVSWIGSFAFDLIGMGEVGSLTRAAVNTANIGSQFLLLNPWGRDQELEADRLGMLIIHWAGYDISGVPAFWQKMSGQNANNFDFFSTHPADEKRINVMRSLVLEIEEGIDYSKPVLADGPKANFTPKIESVPTKTCPKCGSDVADDAIFCTNCGEKFDEHLFCPNCGVNIKEGDAFCTSCGFKLTDELKCSNCGQKVNEGDVFCTNCGNKL
ncbi:M48 family metallopeptidase [Methanobrevibacter sp.]|uniref:M48 family metallopeptidase n=1 Tax=Methanobrevibacter sp. TaxID=66852 RepID=UPI0038902D45